MRRMISVCFQFLVVALVSDNVDAQATTLLEPHYCERVVGRGRGVEEAFNQLLVVINQLQQQQQQLKQEVSGVASGWWGWYISV